MAAELDHGFHRAFPCNLLVEKDEQVWLRYAVLPKWALGGEDFEDSVALREVVGWLCVGSRRIGMVKLHEWHFPLFPTDREFFNDADAHSLEASEFARATLSAWPIERLTEHGSLLQVSRVWMAAEHARTSLWAAAINGLIRSRYRRGYAAMLLNTWPQDYKADDIDVDGWRGRHRWDRRRTALAHLAERRLGVRPLPRGCPGDDAWWRWRPLTAGIPKPRRRLSWI